MKYNGEVILTKSLITSINECVCINDEITDMIKEGIKTGKFINVPDVDYNVSYNHFIRDEVIVNITMTLSENKDNEIINNMSEDYKSSFFRVEEKEELIIDERELEEL